MQKFIKAGAGVSETSRRLMVTKFVSVAWWKTTSFSSRARTALVNAVRAVGPALSRGSVRPGGAGWATGFLTLWALPSPASPQGTGLSRTPWKQLSPVVLV